MRTGLRAVVAAFFTICLFALTFVITPVANAMTQIELKDLSYAACPEELGAGMVTAGSSQKANCYLIHGTAVNRSGKPVVNADVFGRVYDANNNPVMQNRTRLGSIDEVPPGESPFELRISVAANQPEPLKLEQFKSSGFTGKVRR
jgi:hypothetical protein